MTPQDANVFLATSLQAIEAFISIVQAKSSYSPLLLSIALICKHLKKIKK